MKRIILFGTVAALAVLLCPGCSSSERGDYIAIMSWNVQNFFDDVDNGTEYREFDPGLGEWNYDCFSRKAAALADVITSAVPGCPDIVLLQEIENANALKHLNENYLKSSGYEYSLFLPTENSAVGTAVLSRMPLQSVTSHAVHCDGEVRGRSIAELEFILTDDASRLVVFVNHWKSKLGGAEETEPYRIAAAQMLSGLIREAGAASPDALILAAGDFNESHDEYERTGGSYPTAVSAEGLAGAGGLKLYNPWVDSELSGSYCYNGSWETIDQFFLSEGFLDGTGWEFTGFETVITDFNTTSGGYPLAWQSSSGAGCSDHFPIMMEMEYGDIQ